MKITAVLNAPNLKINCDIALRTFDFLFLQGTQALDTHFLLFDFFPGFESISCGGLPP
jgi:hypothetical protein